MCVDGTRIELREKILGWLSHSETGAHSLKQAELMRLSGLACPRKSSFANTIAQIIEKSEAFDLTCFCRKCDDRGSSRPERVFPTLAYHIAQYHPTDRSALVSLLLGAKGAGILTADLEKQFVMLFSDLLPKAAFPAAVHVVVIDALDECCSPAELEQLAKLLFSLANSVPWLQVFVTSAPVPDIVGR